MNDRSPVKIECPACGQHYSLDLGDEEAEITCSKCNAQFTACREDEPQTAATTTTPQMQRTMLRPVPRSLKRAGSFLDGFMGLLFRFGKTFAGILALVFLLGVLLSGLVFVLNLRSSIEIPTYKQIASKASDDKSGSSELGVNGLDQRRGLEKNFGDRVAKLIKINKLDEDLYDRLMVMLSRLSKDYRADYLSGLEDVLDELAKSAKDNKGELLSKSELIKSYTEAFVESEATATSAKSTAKTARWSALGAALLCCFMLFMMLIIPALLKIEENTRKSA